MQKLDIMSAVYRSSLNANLKSVLLRMIHVGKLTDVGISDIFIKLETLAEDLSICEKTIRTHIEDGVSFGILKNNRPHKYAKSNYDLFYQAIVDKSRITCEEKIEVVTITTAAGNHYHPEVETITTKQGTENKASYEALLYEGERPVDKPSKDYRIEQIGSGLLTYDRIITKLNHMRRGNEIYGSQLFKSNESLAGEIAFHIDKRDRSKTIDDVHAFNSAVRLIKRDKWRTPRGMMQSKLKANNQLINNQPNALGVILDKIMESNTR